MATIIICDDSELCRRVLRLTIESMRNDVACVEVATGAELLNYIKANEHPSLVFLDLRMPDRDGFRTLADLQAMEASFKDLKIVAYSVLASEADKVRSLEAGFDAFLGKPFSRSELTLLLTNLLGGETGGFS